MGTALTRNGPHVDLFVVDRGIEARLEPVRRHGGIDSGAIVHTAFLRLAQDRLVEAPRIRCRTALMRWPAFVGVLGASGQ